MRLKFYLLWFDDQLEWVKSQIDSIKKIVEDKGFEWVEPKIYKKEEEFKGNYNDYDIILMDYSLTDGTTEGKTGANIIENIRDNECFTNILFYSQRVEDELRNQISSKKIDGVFCTERDSLIEKFEKLFETTIKKVEDVNNLRGLVMAETADLDGLKEEIITLYDDITECPKKKDITRKILDNIKKTNDEGKKFFDSINENTPFKEFLDRIEIDLHKKSRIIHNINHRDSAICNFKHSSFDEEIIQKRNLLAHVKERKDVSGKIVLESDKNGKKLTFSQDEAKTIRKDISRYRSELEKLRDFLNDKENFNIGK